MMPAGIAWAGAVGVTGAGFGACPWPVGRRRKKRAIPAESSRRSNRAQQAKSRSGRGRAWERRGKSLSGFRNVPRGRKKPAGGRVIIGGLPLPFRVLGEVPTSGGAGIRFGLVPLDRGF